MGERNTKTMYICTAASKIIYMFFSTVLCPVILYTPVWTQPNGCSSHSFNPLWLISNVAQLWHICNEDKWQPGPKESNWIGEVIPMREHFISVPLCFLPHSCLCTSLEATLYVHYKLKIFSQKNHLLQLFSLRKQHHEKVSEKRLLPQFHLAMNIFEKERAMKILSSKEPQSWKILYHFSFFRIIYPYGHLQTECFKYQRHSTLQNYINWCLCFIILIRPPTLWRGLRISW